MRFPTAILLLFFFTFSIDLSSCSSNFQFDAELQVSADGCSRENVGECLEMSSKRILWAATAVGGGGKKRYISYEALRRDNVPCNRPGMPYYNCHALPKANPYTRGCSVITGCARGD
ncbi:rapid alkalinization factor-like [Asparagus officinalis]|nr:rapid alkalinization factor-like [Asparagus officinalis]